MLTGKREIFSHRTAYLQNYTFIGIIMSGRTKRKIVDLSTTESDETMVSSLNDVSKTMSDAQTAHATKINYKNRVR